MSVWSLSLSKLKDMWGSLVHGKARYLWHNHVIMPLLWEYKISSITGYWIGISEFVNFQPAFVCLGFFLSWMINKWNGTSRFNFWSNTIEMWTQSGFGPIRSYLVFLYFFTLGSLKKIVHWQCTKIGFKFVL